MSNAVQLSPDSDFTNPPAYAFNVDGTVYLSIVPSPNQSSSDQSIAWGYLCTDIIMLMCTAGNSASFHGSKWNDVMYSNPQSISLFVPANQTFWATYSLNGQGQNSNPSVSFWFQPTDPSVTPKSQNAADSGWIVPAGVSLTNR